VLDYDLVVLAISIAFVARYGLRCVPPISRGLAGATVSRRASS
jgi:hypothetical protein